MDNLKYYYFLLIISICTFSFINVKSYNAPLKGKSIYLDIGHGGVDSGTKYKDILEKDINLEIGYELMGELENVGAKVYMTRYDDYDLSNNGAYFRKRSDLANRAKIINDSNCDMFISIHLNATMSSKWSGAQVFYDNINASNAKIATVLEQALSSERKSMELKGQYMYERVKVPGVLIELGFLSNSLDRAKLLDQETRHQMILKIVKGIVKYYE